MSRRDLLARLAAGPRFLILGQAGNVPSNSGRSSGPNPPDHASQVDSQTAGSLADQFDSDDHEVREELDEISDVAWSGVLTSRVDSALSASLETEWRRVVRLPASSRPFLRNPTELQVRHLFGGSDLPLDERPPLDDLSWTDARQDANDVLDELARVLVTPRGVIVIDDWSLNDWLTPEELYNLARRLGPSQLHLFSSTDEISRDQHVSRATEREWLTLHDESLPEFLRVARDQGFSPAESTGISQHVKLVPTKSGFVELAVDLWNRTLKSARPVDLEVLEPFAHSSGPIRYQRFRTFLGASEGAPPWRAVASGFKLNRDYEDDLHRRVDKALEDPDLSGPIILQGQSASGKSLALIHLAQSLAREGKAAVLHQSRRRDRPLASDIEEYGIWAETAAGLRTVLIWDGMTDPEDYFALDRQLRARGQRVLIVGSSYLSESQASSIVNAQVMLSTAEVERMEGWLRSNSVPVESVSSEIDASFLALLYRLLPETESGLRRGLTLELRAAEAGLEAKSRDQKAQVGESRLTAIAQALKAAGYAINELTPSEHSHDQLSVLPFLERSKTEQLSAMLLSAGRRRLAVPLELALRVIGQAGAQTITDFLRSYDIFRWTEDERGSQFLGVRTGLEAELIAREDLTDPAEVEVACSFIEHVRSNPSVRTGGDEVQFVVDLLVSIGPQSEDSYRFSPWFGELADAFERMRGGSAEVHPRLVLTEVNLVREHVKRSQRSSDSTPPERRAKLRAAEELLLLTLEVLEPSSRLRLNLYVELAANLGSQLHEIVSFESPIDPQAVRTLSERLLSAVLKAREADPENHFPVDVLAWSTKDVVNSDALDKREKLRLLAETQASLDSIDPEDLSPKQFAKHQSRLADIARLQEDGELENHYLSQLMDSSEPAAFYLLATRALANSGRREEALHVAFETLVRADPAIRDDWMCARLLLDVFWELKTGKRLLRGSRETVALSSEDWQESLELIDSLHGIAAFDKYRVSFLRGLALFHLGAFSQSSDEFARLGSLGIDLSRRVHLAYLASDANGSPSTFTGRVLSATSDGRRGVAWVDQLNVEIPFTPARFSAVDFRTRNEVLPRFWIGFNYRGAIADPIRMPGRSRIGRT